MYRTDTLQKFGVERLLTQNEPSLIYQVIERLVLPSLFMGEGQLKHGSRFVLKWFGWF